MAGGRFQVLVVDDDADLRQLIRVLLEFDDELEVVGTVGDAEGALEAASACADALDLVVLDNRLGGPVTGLEIASRLRSSCPHAKVLLFTASDADATAGSEIDAVLSKPAIDSLPDVARQLLHA